MSEVVITEFIDEDALRGLAQRFDVHYDPDLPEKPEQLAQLVAGCRALVVRNRTMVTEDLLARTARLKVIGRLGVGLDNIDQDACRRRGIPLVIAFGANETTVAEFTVAAMLTLLRNDVFARTAQVLKGEWPRQASKGKDARGRTIGLVGFGRIAREVAKIARALGMTVVGTSRSTPPDDGAWAEHGVRPIGLDELLGASDVVSIHVALTPQTRRLIDAGAIGRMKDGAFLINTARGGIVDEVALAAALQEGRLAGAVLDVFEHEPLPASSHLNGVPNLLLTAHVAGFSDEANWRQGQIVAEGISRQLLSGA